MRNQVDLDGGKVMVMTNACHGGRLHELANLIHDKGDVKVGEHKIL